MGSALSRAATLVALVIAASGCPAPKQQTASPPEPRVSVHVVGERTLVLSGGTPRVWVGDDRGAAWDLVQTLAGGRPTQSALLLGVGGDSAARDFKSEVVAGGVVVEPDAELRAAAERTLAMAPGAIAASEGAIAAGARFDVVVVDMQDDAAPYATLDATKAARVSGLVSDRGVLLLRRVARPSDPRLAAARKLLALPFQRLVGTSLDDTEQDLILVLSRAPIDGAFIYQRQPRVELPLPEPGGRERNLGNVRAVAAGGAEVTRIGYVGHDRDRLAIDTPCPVDGTRDDWLVGPGAEALAALPLGVERGHPASSETAEGSLQTLIGVGRSDDCTTRYSELAAAVVGRERKAQAGLDVSRVVLTIDAARWRAVRAESIAPRVDAASTAIDAGRYGDAARALGDGLTDLDRRLGAAGRSTRAYDALLTMREIVDAHATVARPCAAMVADADAYFRDASPDQEPLDALRVRAALARCAARER